MKNTSSALPYLTRGSPQQTPLVFLHPFPLNGFFWEEGMRRLCERRYCLAPHLPGFGQGGSVPASPLFFENLVDSFERFLDETKIERAAWCGLSMGGYVALRAMERFPERCSALVLADTKSSSDTDEGRIKRAGALKVLRTEGVEAFLAAQAKGLIGKSHQGDTKILDAYRQIAQANSADGMAAGLVALSTRTDTTDSLAKIRVPTLILVGEEDEVTPPAEARKMQSAIAGSRLVVIPRCGHLSALEAPDVFYSEVGNFLAST